MRKVLHQLKISAQAYAENSVQHNKGKKYVWSLKALKCYSIPSVNRLPLGYGYNVDINSLYSLQHTNTHGNYFSFKYPIVFEIYDKHIGRRAFTRELEYFVI